MIYFIQCGTNGPIKIGRSDDPHKRMAELQTACPYELKMLWIHDANEPDVSLERELHNQLRHEHIRGEWFRPGKDIFFAIHDLDNLKFIEFDNYNEQIITSESMNDISVSFGGYCFNYFPKTGKMEIHEPREYSPEENPPF